MYKLCILDAKTLGEDIDLSVFEKYGEVKVYATTREEEVVERIQDREIIITNKVILNSSNLEYAPKVRQICVAATGTNNVDLAYTRSRNISVCNVAGYSTRSVVQHTFAMLFYLLESSAYYDNYVKFGRYTDSDIFTHLDRPFWELSGKTWGVIGMGQIGRTVAGVAREFGCRVIYYSTSGENRSAEYSRVEMKDLLQTADVVSIHAPLNDRTLNLLHYEQFKLMRPHAFLLNLGRGGIVNEADLARALDEGLIGGAALDVLEQEPMNNENPLLRIKNRERIYITPHIAWASLEARQTLVQEIALNIEAFINGATRNTVV